MQVLKDGIELITLIDIRTVAEFLHNRLHILIHLHHHKNPHNHVV